MTAKPKINKLEIKEEKSSEDKQLESSKKVLIDKRNALINTLKPLLVTKREMWKGGREVRSRLTKESQYQPIVDEINELGGMVEEAPILLSQLRREG